MKMHKAMQTMDLANANDAVFYADDEDVGYIINNKEYAVSIDDSGDVKFIPMNQHRKSKKAPKQDEACTDENCTDDSHGHLVKKPGEGEPGDQDLDNAHDHPAGKPNECVGDRTGQDQPWNEDNDNQDVNDVADQFESLYSSLLGS